MGKSIKVSIITVVYNAADTIEQTIKSVIRQKTENVEYILLDGMSTDGTYEIIRKYKDDVDIIVHEKDNGLYDALNKGIMLASGEIIGIIHGDDYYADGTISKVVAYYDTQDADILYGNALWFDKSGEDSLYACYNIEELWYRMAVPHPAVFVRKEAYLKHGLFDVRYAIAADYELMLRMYSEKARFVHVDEVLAYFRKGGLSAKRQEECIEEAKSISLRYIGRCGEPDKWLHKIEETYAIRKFEQLSEREEGLLIQGIERFMGNKGGNLTIFGIGKWGKRCFQVLESSNIEVDSFVDNNPARWGERYHGILIKSPDTLVDYCGSVLIATSKYEDEIKRQLEGMSKKISILSLSDWAREVLDCLQYIKWEPETI